MSRIIWHSGAPWCPTGYGQQTALFTPRIRAAGHDVAISATWGLTGAAQELGDDLAGMKIYPSDQRHGNVLLPEYAKRHNADLVIALMDAWPLNPEIMRSLPLAVWCPVDHAPTPPKVADFFRKSGARPIAMSRFGEQMLKADGLDPLYVPHGVDTSVYTPEHRDRVRDLAGKTDAFVVGMVANNSGGMPPAGGVSRKAFPQALMAFSEIYHRHNDARLYLHTEMTGRPGIEHGLNIGRLLDRYEIPVDAVMFTNQAEMEIGIGKAEMAGLYASFDVLLNPSYGEGFGIPIIEAQACGTPVIVTDWTAMPELCGAGWLVDGEVTDDQCHEAFFKAPSVALIVDALEQAYDARGDQALRDRAREFALGYDADHVMATYWTPVLEELTRPREVGPLNRAMRREAKKAVTA